MNNYELPMGTRIQVASTPDGLNIYWKNPDSLLLRVGMGAFLLFWMGGWYSGEVSAIQQIARSFREGESIIGFTLFWLGGWTVGGIFAVIILITLLRGPGKSYLALHSRGLLYKRGNPFMGMLSRRKRSAQGNNPLNVLFGDKGVRAERHQISNLQIQQVADGLRITFDIGARREEVGEGLNEPEKEWLHKQLESWLR